LRFRKWWERWYLHIQHAGRASRDGRETRPLACARRRTERQCVTGFGAGTG
jgi:hypothetical protein